MSIKSITLAAAALASVFSVACSIPQSDECAKYVDCQAHYDEVNELSETDTSAYAADGSCWQSNQEGADACTAACESANTSLKEGLEAAEADLGACG